MFDLDGTLFDPTVLTVEATRAALADAGAAVPTDDEITARIGEPDPAIVAWLAERVGPERVAETLERLRRSELAAIPSASLHAGVVEALREVRRVADALAVCTNGVRDYVETVVASTGLDRLVDRVRWRDDGDDKPTMVAELVEAFGGPPAVVVGDRVHDVEAAHANGLPALGVTWGHARPGELADADAVAHRPDELPRLVADLLARRPPGAPTSRLADRPARGRYAQGSSRRR